MIFRDHVDAFIASEKSVEGHARPERNQKNDGWNLLWLISTGGLVTAHRVMITTLDGMPHEFVIMVQYWWPPLSREIPIARLMVRPPDEPHPNRPPLPPGIQEYQVSGSRYYRWTYNRMHFKPNAEGLPYAQPLPARLIDFANAIRFMCGDCGINLAGAQVPDYPQSGRLF